MLWERSGKVTMLIFLYVTVWGLIGKRFVERSKVLLGRKARTERERAKHQILLVP